MIKRVENRNFKYSINSYPDTSLNLKSTDLHFVPFFNPQLKACLLKGKAFLHCLRTNEFLAVLHTVFEAQK